MYKIKYLNGTVKEFDSLREADLSGATLKGVYVGRVKLPYVLGNIMITEVNEFNQIVKRVPLTAIGKAIYE